MPATTAGSSSTGLCVLGSSCPCLLMSVSGPTLGSSSSGSGASEFSAASRSDGVSAEPDPLRGCTGPSLSVSVDSGKLLVKLSSFCSQFGALPGPQRLPHTNKRQVGVDPGSDTL